MPVTQIGAVDLGNFLQIAFSDGIRAQMSADYRDWEMIKQIALNGVPDGKQLQYLLQTSFGPSAVQARGVNQYAFPASQRVGTKEGVATYKEFNATVEIEYNLWNRARKAPSKYAEPLAIEIQSKSVATKRYMASLVYGDGTGVVGQLVGATPAAVTSPASSRLVFDISSADASRGHIGNFEKDDILVLKAADGTATALDTTGPATEPAFWKVVSKNRSTGKVILEGLDSNFAPVANITAVADQPAAGEVFYRFGQSTGATSALSLAGITNSTDYGTLTEVFPGLESLTANDGRLVHGVNLEGVLGGTRYDNTNTAIDGDAIHSALDDAKIAVGKNMYKWSKAVASPAVIRKLISDRDDDRRFNVSDDLKRGSRKFTYQHEDDTLEFVSSEYCPFKRIYLMPEGKSGNSKVLEFHGTDFEPVKGQDMSAFHLRPGASGGHERIMTSYMEALATLICKHPAAFAVITNFTT
jgi:hypothetical protein